MTEDREKRELSEFIENARKEIERIEGELTDYDRIMAKFGFIDIVLRDIFIQIGARDKEVMESLIKSLDPNNFDIENKNEADFSAEKRLSLVKLYAILFVEQIKNDLSRIKKA